MQDPLFFSIIISTLLNHLERFLRRERIGHLFSGKNKTSPSGCPRLGSGQSEHFSPKISDTSYPGMFEGSRVCPKHSDQGARTGY